MIACFRQQWKTRGLLGLALGAVVLCFGCKAPPKQGENYADTGRRGQPLSPPELIDPTTIPTRDDIVAIHQFWPNVPWLWEADRVVGFRAPVYFVSGQTEKGAFVPGTIFVWVYTLERGPDRKPTRNLAHMWEFDESAALNYRVRKEGVAGYFYGFMLNWPPNVELEGRLIEIEFGYERRDKTVVTGAARRFRVPVSADYVPATKKETP
ncbi:MAG TPA: hypothetical protein VM487_05625 [Phycisphaerae bacterium]|nr:hypothetical protein [Phycisphaerae bacterium]